MSYPTKYTRQYDFQSYQNLNPNRPLPGDKVNADLNAVVTSTDEIVDFLKTSLRADGAVMNGAIGYDQLSTALQTAGLAPATPWAAGTAYTVNQSVLFADSLYRCVANHTSGDFNADLNAGRWQLLATLTINYSAGAGLQLTGLTFSVSNLTTAMFAANVVDTDGTLTANSDTRIPSQKAVKTYADQIVAAADAMVFKGVIDCSASPNYPAADRGWTYKVSVAGKIGGASGVNVEVGDTLMCLTDGTVSGTQAAVGAQWNIVQANVDGAVVGPTSAVSGRIATFSGTSGKVIQDGGLAIGIGQYPGETSNGSATAGNIGEYVESNIAAGSATSLTSTTAKTVTSISLTAGDWDVSASIAFTGAGGVSITFVEGSISLTTNTVDQTVGRNAQINQGANVHGASPSHQFAIGPVRLSLSGTTTVYLVANSTFTVGTLSAYGLLRARRIR